MIVFKEEFQKLAERYPDLTECEESIKDAYEILYRCAKEDKFIFTAGNGGSAADADHITGELLKGFTLKRPLSPSKKKMLKTDSLKEKLQEGFRAVNLMAQSAICSAVENDLGGELIIAQQINSLGRKGDVLMAISTSGNSRNIELGCETARMKGMKIIGMTGIYGGKLLINSDVCIRVPETDTYKIQELHLPVYHFLCMILEKSFFKV